MKVSPEASGFLSERAVRNVTLVRNRETSISPEVQGVDGVSKEWQIPECE